jgi:hypothetical protein
MNACAATRGWLVFAVGAFRGAALRLLFVFVLAVIRLLRRAGVALVALLRFVSRLIRNFTH